MQAENYIVNRSWAEVDLNAIAHNIRTLRSMVWKSTEIMAVVKADAYGHGVAHVAGELLANGADRLAVSLVDEGIELRRSGIRAPILILSYSDPRRAGEIVKYGLTQTIYSRELAEALDRAAEYLGVVAPVHVKVDTGMSRVGLPVGYDAVREIMELTKLSHLSVEGVFTHFATADEEDTSFVRRQFGLFLNMCQELEKAGIYVPIKHCCNSAATLRFPDMHMDMVRPGLLLYGVMPDCCERYDADFQAAMSLKSNVIQSKTISPGTAVSYGRKFIAEKETRVATVPIGYADGYPRSLSGKSEALIHGRRCPVIGSICMDSCMLDVSALEEPVQMGDEVVLYGHQLDREGRMNSLSVRELAEQAGSIPYELLCALGKRVPRVYLKAGRVVDITSKII